MSAHAFSASARAKIEAKGGTCEVVAQAETAEPAKTPENLLDPTTMFASIANTFSNCFKIPELKSRIFFTVLVLAICRLVAFVRIPGLDGAVLAEFFDRTGGGGGMLGMYSLFTGGAMEHCAVGALGIMPYISATIIIQLLTAVIPQLSKLAREEGGARRSFNTAAISLCCFASGRVWSWRSVGSTREHIRPGIGRLVLYDDRPSGGIAFRPR